MGFVPRGIIPPIITPLTDEGEVNYPVLRQMVNHLIDNGVHGLFPLGTTGEFYAFDDDTYRKILENSKGRNKRTCSGIWRSKPYYNKRRNPPCKNL